VDGKATGREANLALILAERVANVAGIIAGIMSARGERTIFALSQSQNQSQREKCSVANSRHAFHIRVIITPFCLQIPPPTLFYNLFFAFISRFNTVGLSAPE